MEFTINHYYSKQKSRCGYCKGTKSSVSQGMHAYTMFPQDYQELIDRGWRRSGLYCYKPLNNLTCCPCYTIRCNALEFKLTKSHKKILKRMTRFLRDGKKDKTEEAISAVSLRDHEAEEDCGGCSSKTFGGIRDEPQEPSLPISCVDLAAVAAANPERHEAARLENENFGAQTPLHQQNPDAIQVGNAEKSLLEGSQKSLPRKKAKLMRQERKQAKLAAKGITDLEEKSTALKKLATNSEKNLSDYFREASPNDKHKLTVILIPPNKKRVTDEAFKLYKKYQLLVHNDDPNRLTPSSLERFCYKSPLKYTKTRDGPTGGYGSFHQQYWLDDKLIAVAVIDILPYCVSSVYFFYDPDYSFLSLGTYGSLREIELVQQLAKTVPALTYYYMGFYIHSCPKMRYKGRLVPSYLLCPETYTWHTLTDEIRTKLDQHKYQRFNPDKDAKDVDNFEETDLNDVVLLYDNTYLTYQQYIQITGDDDDRDLILEYGKLVGKSLAHRMLYVKT